MIDHNEIRIARTEMQRRLRLVPGCEDAVVSVIWREAEYVGCSVPAWQIISARCGNLAVPCVGASDFRRAQSSFYAALAKIEPSNAEDVLKAKLAERRLELKGMI